MQKDAVFWTKKRATLEVIADTYTDKTQGITTNPCESSQFMRYEAFGVLPEHPNNSTKTDFKVHLKAVIGSDVKLEEWGGGLNLQGVGRVLHHLGIEPYSKK